RQREDGGGQARPSREYTTPPRSPVLAASSTYAIATGNLLRNTASNGPMPPLVCPYIAPSSASFAAARSPSNASAASAAYRSPSAAARARPRSPDTAASTRGSSCPASATTSDQPSSAMTARRMMRGICSAPLLRVAQRPDTTPPTTYSGRYLPPFTQASCQAQPCAACSRESSLYSMSSSMPG